MRKKEGKGLAKKLHIKYYIDAAPDTRSKKWQIIRVGGYETNLECNKKTLVIRDRASKLPAKQENNRGYMLISIRHPHDGRKVHLGVHRILCALYIEIPLKYRHDGFTQCNLVPNHIDGDKSHNVLDNLEWTTVKDNTIHAFDTGLANVSKGEKSHLATITEEQARKICTLLSEGKSVKEISKALGIKERTVRAIYDRQSWKWLSKEFEFPKRPDRSIPYSKDDELIHKICQEIQDKYIRLVYTDKMIGEKFGVSREFVKDIRTRRRRKDISQYYKF